MDWSLCPEHSAAGPIDIAPRRQSKGLVSNLQAKKEKVQQRLRVARSDQKRATLLKEYCALSHKLRSEPKRWNIPRCPGLMLLWTLATRKLPFPDEVAEIVRSYLLPWYCRAAMPKHIKQQSTLLPRAPLRSST
ncbi:hypothetical protein DIPPA_06838 [Diplonema papillatum]|nr:hypothetical protein DIPPA_06838 [Diplonema papillatum]